MKVIVVLLVDARFDHSRKTKKTKVEVLMLSTNFGKTRFVHTTGQAPPANYRYGATHVTFTPHAPFFFNSFNLRCELLIITFYY